MELIDGTLDCGIFKTGSIFVEDRFSAICSGVIGTCGLMLVVGAPPVTAQVMITGLAMMKFPC